MTRTKRFGGPASIAHTVPTGCTIIAFHRALDICAVRLEDGSEALFINGYRTQHEHPVQAVVAFCHLSTRAASRMAAALVKSRKHDENNLS